jgi:hypothetical protein
MGFWDFVAPDLDSFRDVLSPYVPYAVQLGRISIDRDQLLDLAWLSPASAAGLAARVAYSYLGAPGGTPQDSQNAMNQLLDSLARGGQYTPQPGSPGNDLSEGLGMAPIVVANAYSATVYAQVGGHPILNTFHCTGAGGGHEVAVATALQAAWKVAFGPIARFDNKYTLVQFEAIDLTSTSGGIWRIADTTPGTRTAAELAGRQTSSLISFNGQTRNRSQRGRCYLGPLYEGDISSDGATITGASQTAITNAMNLFRASMNTAGYPIVVLSRKLLTTYPITLQVVQPIQATQRRRLR